MLILTVNTGSSSVRLVAFERDDHGNLKAIASDHFQNDGSDPQTMLRAFSQKHDLAKVHLVAHRVVNGGVKFNAPILINEAVENEIEQLVPLAPLHNPVALRWIRAAKEVWGDGVPQIGVFDTAFYVDLPEVARTYALPGTLSKKYGFRRYGFHGIAHQAMWQCWCKLQPEKAANGRVISFQLGAGCSITASKQGKPCDTSMGFSPLEGLVMATRSGDVDAGLLTYLQQHEGLSPEQTNHILNHESGLLGVSGISADMRTLLDSEDENARLAIALYCYRARKYLGAYLAVLGGAEAIIFGGGVGEHAPAIRAAILEGMEWAGIVLDEEKNLAAIAAESCISAPGSQIKVWVILVDEAAILAQNALALVAH
ncbi:acetate/propionate family kinase [Sulfurirhabdus autotrophica]|uniref:Acetate kinase n=1 Tax=Sulfurirhabdus autotrophica TaxID=1706046 RepID=A0A4R3XZB1_9PROT|nr:acetate/propionate family kinase [Sulfurirhabdus autotrophica]TCV85115.1 acetate kinase [Sulfurirhabdus autotrophica]